MKKKSAELGRWGEETARKLLVSKGYAIRHSNWKMPPYEIDLVAMKGTRIVFVEVKTRAKGEFDPVDAINRKKQSNMIKSAHAYLVANELPNDVQFDVVLIVGTPETGYTIDHLEDAFYPQLTKY